jgi:hypothetical protein
MDRNEALKVASALNEAIWLRDNIHLLSRVDVEDGVKRLAVFGVFSNRQIQAITAGRVSHQSVARITGKSNKSGGSLNPGSLELLRSVLYRRAESESDFDLISQAVELGTSQHMVAKLTGVSQSTISKKLKEDNG